MTDGDADPRLRFIWDEALRALEYQKSTLNDIRLRATTLLTAASISAAFLASVVLGDEEAKFGVATWVGVASYAVVGLTAAVILWPFAGWKFHREAKSILDGYIETKPPADIDEMHRTLALHLSDDYERNAPKVRWLQGGVALSCLALATEIVAFLVDLHGRR